MSYSHLFNDSLFKERILSHLVIEYGPVHYNTLTPCLIPNKQIKSKYYSLRDLPSAFNKNRKSYLTHRALYILNKGLIAENQQVRHKCDNCLCNNIEHLELGSHFDNMQDKILRGTQLKEEEHGRSKLSNKQRKEIYTRGLNGEQYTKIAKDFNITSANVRIICTDKNKNNKRRFQFSVIAFLLDGTIIAQYDTKTIAAKALNTFSGHIDNCINGKRKSAGKYNNQPVYWAKA